MDAIRIASPLNDLSQLAAKIENILPVIEKNNNLNAKCQYLTALQDQIRPQLTKAAIFLAQQNIPQPVARDMAPVRREEARLNRLFERIERSLNETFPLAIPVEPEPEPAHPVLPEIGLRNRSASDCFLNALIQFLLHIPDYRKAVLQFAGIKETVPEIAHASLQLLRDQVKGEVATTADTQKVRAAIHKAYPNMHLGLNGQKDASALLGALLETSDKKAALFKILTTRELAQGTHPPINTALRNNTSPIEEEETPDTLFMYVKRPKKEEDLSDLLSAKSEVYSFENHLTYLFDNPDYKPDEPIRRTATDGVEYAYLPRSEQVRIKDAPRNLLITVKRFEAGTRGTLKLETEVAMPMEFTMPGQYVQYLKNPKEPKDVKYELDAFIRHSGGDGYGHYYCFVKKPDGTWHKLNDSSASNAPMEGEGGVIEESKVSYIYHYRLVNEEGIQEIV